jgi:hypothetical protein
VSCFGTERRRSNHATNGSTAHSTTIDDAAIFAEGGGGPKIEPRYATVRNATKIHGPNLPMRDDAFPQAGEEEARVGKEAAARTERMKQRTPRVEQVSGP